MWLLLQGGMNNSIPCATTSKVPLDTGLNEGRLSCSPLLTWLPLINQRSKTDTPLHSCLWILLFVTFSHIFTLISTVFFFFLNAQGSSERGQPHNKHKGALSAGENVVYRLCYNGLVVAGSHAHFLIFGSHAISFWEKTELWGFAFVWEGRLTTYFLSRQAQAPLPPPCSSPPLPLSGGATIFVWDL